VQFLRQWIEREKKKGEVYTKLLRNSHELCVLGAPTNPEEIEWLRKEALKEGQGENQATVECCARIFDAEDGWFMNLPQ
jgi:hypothetical protein